MTDDNVTNLPTGNITFNLDEVQRDKSEVHERFVALVNGRSIEMTDPAEFDWQDLLDIANPHDFLRYCVSPEDRSFLLDEKVPGWKFGKLMEAYQRHFGLDERIEQLRKAERRGDLR